MAFAKTTPQKKKPSYNDKWALLIQAKKLGATRSQADIFEYILFNCYQFKSGCPNCNQDTIAEDTEYSKRSVKGAIAFLKEHNLLEVNRPRGMNRRNIYIPNYDILKDIKEEESKEEIKGEEPKKPIAPSYIRCKHLYKTVDLSKKKDNRRKEVIKAIAPVAREGKTISLSEICIEKWTKIFNNYYDRKYTKRTTKDKFNSDYFKRDDRFKYCLDVLYEKVKSTLPGWNAVKRISRWVEEWNEARNLCGLDIDYDANKEYELSIGIYSGPPVSDPLDSLREQGFDPDGFGLDYY